MPLNIVPVRVNSDNYAYLLLTNSALKHCTAVDPSEPTKVQQAAQDLGWTITSLLTTHHHWDHSNGNEELAQAVGPSLKVFGFDERIPALTHRVADKTPFALDEVTVTPLFTACHTKGSVSFLVEQDGDKAVFTGDTLFIAGCGRFFEGTPQEMHTSLNVILASLPDDTKVFCGHEYTQSNLRFALSVEPHNEDIKAKLAWCDANPVTVPSTIGQEKRINPFMRVQVADVQKAVGSQDPVVVMEKLRELKNNF
ncbi:hypothetical protein HDU98_011766 [Podochytrium sp. JEL0797]|nr:hypothetical protein HDU98_011766 [Podochytrium sp. JEL0797]